ncbi:hypothetical protein FNV43_RR26719 [Rhamnella rubrinervis]|uniref:RNase H type-1 domain-containing protein n=1 Tax=Rhamnella rubrinervis TaxID=2594499 RepID=A0A8K0GPH0_9ROSA|nr:hypothetical protein FNV43_RR26719 [Rhamnella rubrinervis]
MADIAVVEEILKNCCVVAADGWEMRISRLMDLGIRNGKKGGEKERGWWASKLRLNGLRPLLKPEKGSHVAKNSTSKQMRNFFGNRRNVEDGIAIAFDCINKALLSKLTWKLMDKDSFVFRFLQSGDLCDPNLLISELVDSDGVWNLPTSFRAAFIQLTKCIKEVVVAKDRTDERVWVHSVSGTISCRDFISIYLLTAASTICARSLAFIWATTREANAIQKGLIHNSISDLPVFRNLGVVGVVHSSIILVVCSPAMGCFAVPLDSCYAFESELLGVIIAIEYTQDFRVSHIFRKGNIVADALSKIAVSSPRAQWWWGLPDSYTFMHHRNVNGFANYRSRK